MKAVRTVEMSGPGGLRIEEVAAPVPGPDEVAVRVRATAINRADLLQTMGLYPAPAGTVQDIPGLEFSGEVSALGARVTRWKIGDPVMGIVSGGAWAETVTIHERQVIRAPTGVSLEHAAAIPEVFFTAYDALVLQAGMTSGSTVLVHAVASGVGTAAVQLCRLFGASVIGTARSANKLERITGLLGSVATTNGPVFAAQVKALTGNRGVDIVLDLVGGAFVPESIDALAHKGTIMLVGLVAGPTAGISLGGFLTKRATLKGTALRARPLEEKIALAQKFEAHVVPKFENGELAPVVDAVLPMSDIAAALSRMAKNDTFGKTILTW